MKEYVDKIRIYRIRICIISLFSMILLNNCQTFYAGYGPGNSPNWLLIIVDKGTVQLKLYSKIIEYKNVDDNRNKRRDISTGEILSGILDATFEEIDRELDSIKLSAGNQFTYFLKHNETATIQLKSIKEDGNDEPVEIIIKYNGRERKYKLRTNTFSRSFSYTGG
jgi:hypothetical protein